MEKSYKEILKKFNKVSCNLLPNLLSDLEYEYSPNVDFDNTTIYQYYVTDADMFDVEELTTKYEDMIFAYSEKIDTYILCVPFFGIDWDDYKVKEL